MTTIEDMYKHFGALADAKEKAGEHEEEYTAILSAVKSGTNEKRLASQFTARFFKFFPKLADKGLEAMFTLCADTDVTIRKQVIKDLPMICRDSVGHSARVAHVLTGCLQTDDTTELSVIQMSLVTLLKADPKETMEGIFSRILNDEEEMMRERAIGFLGAKTKLLLAEDLLPKDVEDAFIQHCKKVLEDVTGHEFQLFMRILTSLPSMTTVQGRQNLLDIIISQAELGSKFEPKSPECVDCLILCLKEAMPLLSKNVHSNKLVEYVCLCVLPVLNEIVVSTENSKDNESIQLELLKLVAEMIINCGDIEKIEECVINIYNCLITFMPLPNPDETANETTTPDLNFSSVECLMFTFHHLARRCPQILTDKEHADRLKDFRLRLQYFARGVQIYIKCLKTTLQGKAGETLKTDQKKTLSIALEVTNNISSLIKDLFYNPPAYKAIVVLSFKKQNQAVKKQATTPAATQQQSQTQTPSPPVTGTKRPSFTPVTFSSDEPAKKLAKTEQKRYAPPGGKFSEKAGVYPAQQQQQQRGGGGRRAGFKRW